LSRSPIGKVLSTIRKHRVRALLMGGQACILYGAAEFSRDVDLAVAADERNLERLRRALAELEAEPIYVPALGRAVLRRGHACHFRVQARAAKGLRIDIMSALHGCGDFESLWKRRRRLRLAALAGVPLLDLRDLVQAKKTQRDKDWPMLRRLVEVDYESRRGRPSAARIAFWLREARTAELLTELCSKYPKTARRLSSRRAAIDFAIKENQDGIERALRKEEEKLRALDRAYWRPLREELFRWRQARRGRI